MCVVHVWTRFAALTGALALAALAPLADPAGAAEEAQFTCRVTQLGLCRPDYVGPRDAAAARHYMAEAEAAAAAALEAHPHVAAMQYRPGLGTLTVTPVDGVTLSIRDLKEIAEPFLSARLRLERVFAPGAALAPGRDRGGRSRFQALSDHIAAAADRVDASGVVEVASLR